MRTLQLRFHQEGPPWASSSKGLTWGSRCVVHLTCSTAPPLEQPHRCVLASQDVRYLWGYAAHAVLPGATQRFEQLVRFRDFSWNIEYKALGSLSALASTVYGVHHWLKTGLYSLVGAETSQSNGNAQVLYAFVRGAAKQYGALWFGQVSIFNCE